MLREIVGRYQIQKRLGSGAWATVYEALDTSAFERRVAIKVFRLPPLGDAASAEEHARFRQGARAAGRLAHPNVVSVFDYGENDESAWIVMELVEGETLKSVLDSGERLDTALIVRIMGQILDALGYTHSRGVVHRDIKPANIMLTRDRVVKITDFGVARIEDSSMTHAGTVLGSPSYMAPEQFRGDPVDHRADIWAAGVILYQLLTGERPFEGSVTSVMQKALYVEPVVPSQTRAAVPTQFDAVVAKALAKRPEARFASAAEFAEAVRTAAAGLKPKPPPRLAAVEDATLAITPDDAPLDRWRPRARRRRPAWLLPAAAGSAMVIVLGAVGVMLLPATPSEPASPMARRTGSEETPDPTAGPRGPAARSPGSGAGSVASPFERNLPATPAPEPTPPKPQPQPRLAESRPPAAPAPEPTPPQPRLAEPRVQPVTPVPPAPPAMPPLPLPGPPQRAPEPPLADLRSLAVAAGSAFQCGVVSASVSADRIVFRGIAPWAEIQAAQRTITNAGLPSQAAQMQAVESFDPAYCGVLAALEEIVAGPGAPQLTLAGPNPLPAGQVLRVHVQMPDWPAYLALFTLMPQGEAAQLIGSGRNPARANMLLTNPAWEATAPFGSELLIAIATDRPLFAQQRTLERLDSLATALGPALRAARENGGRVTAQVIALRTVPR